MKLLQKIYNWFKPVRMTVKATVLWETKQWKDVINRIETLENIIYNKK